MAFALVDRYRRARKVSGAVVAVLATLVALVPVDAHAAAPSNDRFSNRTVIQATPFDDSASTLEATIEQGEPTPSCAGERTNSVWYEYTPTAAGSLQADTLGSDYDTVVAIWTGPSLGSLNEVTCQDDVASSFQSVAVFDAIPGTTYFIQVSGFAAGGNLSFRLGTPTFGSISGAVRSESGEGLPNICVDVYDPAIDEYVGFSTTDSSGRFIVTGLADGIVQVEYRDWCDEREDLLNEWFDDQPTHQTANEVAVAAPLTTRGIDAVLSPVRLSVTKTGDGTGLVTSSNRPGIACGEDCEEIYEQDMRITLTPAADNSSFFVGWSGCDAVEGIDCVVFMDDARSVEARFDLDLVAPETTITSGPDNPTGLSSAVFSFTSSESRSTFACALDGEPFSPCTSPKSFSGLADGEHTFQVRATDIAGNTDPSPASQTWTVDSTLIDTKPPETTITSGPSGMVSSRSASFSFTASEEGSTFACSLDGSAYTPCSSPLAYESLADGSHTFRVQATDAAGNVDPSPAERTWVVDAEGPGVAILRPTAGLYVNDQAAVQTGPAVIVVGSVTVEASAADAQSGVSAFRFEVNGTPVDPSQVTAQGGTYRFTFRPTSPGEHTITARATNGSGISSALIIRVQGIPAS